MSLPKYTVIIFAKNFIYFILLAYPKLLETSKFENNQSFALEIPKTGEISK